MSFLLRLSILVLSLGPLGCLSALQKHNEQVRAERRSEGIATACQQKDPGKLEEYLKYEPNDENRKAASMCLVDLRIAALTSADCKSFSSAFNERDEHMEGDVKVSRQKKSVGFSRQLEALTEAQRTTRYHTILDKAWSCNDGAVLFGNAANALILGNEKSWVALYDRLDRKKEEPVIDRLLTYLREDAPASTPDGARILAWLGEKKPASRCKDIEEATRRTQGTIRYGLLQFFVNNDCKPEAVTLATEYLTSKSAGARMNGCLAFGILKDKSRVAEMRRLAKSDTARALDSERVGYFTYAYVTYPVREACQQTLNELEIDG